MARCVIWRIAIIDDQTQPLCRLSWLLAAFVLSHVRLIGVVALLALSLVNVCVATDREASPSKVTGWAGIDRWQFELESVLTFDNGPEPSPDRAFIIHRLFAASRSGLYHFSGKDLDPRMGHVSWLQEPFNVETTLRDGKLISNSYFNRCFRTIGFGLGLELPHYIERDTLTFVVPVWPIKPYQSPQVKPGILLVVGEAAKSERYKRTQELAIVGREECYVLEAINHCDRIWISRAKELCVMRRDIKDPLTKALLLSIIAKRIEQVRPGLWMPVVFECVVFDGIAGEGEPKKQFTTVTRVFNWKFNSEVPDERFVPTIRPGSIEESGDGVSFHQLDNGGIDHLDEIAAFFLANGFPVRYDGSKGNAVAGIVLFVIGVAGGYIVSRAVSKVRRKRPVSGDAIISAN